MSAQAVIGVVVLAAGLVLGFILLAGWLIHLGRDDTLGLPEPDYAPLGEMPAEIAHDGCPFGPAPRPVHLGEHWQETIQAPPAAMAALSASQADYTGAGPGTAAAAGDNPPPASPPPLPTDDDIDVLVRMAIDRPGSEPFPAWLLEEFVDRYNAAQNGRK